MGKEGGVVDNSASAPKLEEKAAKLTTGRTEESFASVGHDPVNKMKALEKEVQSLKKQLEQAAKPQGYTLFVLILVALIAFISAQALLKVSATPGGPEL